MAEIPFKVKNIIEKYITALENNNIPVKQAVLFGSYAVVIIMNGVISILHLFPMLLKE